MADLLPFTPAEPDLSEQLPACAQVDTASKALVVAVAAIEAGKWISVRPLPMGHFEVRCKDEGWLARCLEVERVR